MCFERGDCLGGIASPDSPGFFVSTVVPDGGSESVIGPYHTVLTVLTVLTGLINIVTPMKPNHDSVGSADARGQETLRTKRRNKGQGENGNEVYQ